MAVPPVPSGLQATAGNAQVMLTWTPQHRRDRPQCQPLDDQRWTMDQARCIELRIAL
jgi:hypothetical protein